MPPSTTAGYRMGLVMCNFRGDGSRAVTLPRATQPRHPILTASKSFTPAASSFIALLRITGVALIGSSTMIYLHSFCQQSAVTKVKINQCRTTYKYCRAKQSRPRLKWLGRDQHACGFRKSDRFLLKGQIPAGPPALIGGWRQKRRVEGF